ncbi:hypothetical protein ASE03_28430 [Kitasatospora sp. Root187]|nr:hypothetical protein ASE03_28430 [Kitasatospora sp. Root187]
MGAAGAAGRDPARRRSHQSSPPTGASTSRNGANAAIAISRPRTIATRTSQPPPSALPTDSQKPSLVSLTVATGADSAYTWSVMVDSEVRAASPC